MVQKYKKYIDKYFQNVIQVIQHTNTLNCK